MNQQALISIYSNPPKIQNFSLPENIIFYISKNSSTAKVYNKLIYLCKYFYLCNPFITFEDSCFIHFEENWIIREITGHKNLDLKLKTKNLPEKIWCNGFLKFSNEKFPYSYFPNFFPRVSSSLIEKKIYRCDITKLELCKHILTLNEFEFFISSGSIKIFKLHSSIIKNSEEKIVPIENLIEKLPNLEEFYCLNFTVDEHLNLITSETAKALTEIPHFNNLKIFSIENAPEGFDIWQFLGGLKKPIKMDIELIFEFDISYDYKGQIHNYAYVLSQCWPYKNMARTPLIIYKLMTKDAIDKLHHVRDLEIQQQSTT